MNITFICNEYPPRPQGGIGTFVYFFARELRRRGHKITVAGIWERDTETDDDGIRVVTRASSMGRDVLRDRREFSRWLAADAAANRTDLVEVPEYQGMLPFRFDACPVVVRLHQSSSGIALNRLRPPRAAVYWCERQTLRHHRHWIAVSRFVLSYTRRVFLLRPSNSAVIYNFAPNLSEPDPALVQTLRDRFGDFVLYVGKVTAAKGAFDLARAARLFLRRRPGLSLVYVGKDLPRRGTQGSALIRTTLGPSLASRVHFAGVRPHSEIAAWMAAARVYIQPSHLEAFSLLPLEAIHCGAPVIFTRRASGPEVIVDGMNGLLVEPSRPKQIAAAVGRLVEQPGFAARLSQQARSSLGDRFSVEKCAQESLSFYQSVPEGQK